MMTKLQRWLLFKNIKSYSVFQEIFLLMFSTLEAVQYQFLILLELLHYSDKNLCIHTVLVHKTERLPPQGEPAVCLYTVTD